MLGLANTVFAILEVLRWNNECLKKPLSCSQQSATIGID